MKRKWTWKQYEEYVAEVGCCPCGYVIQDELSKYTHWSLHLKNREVTEDGKLKIK